MSPGSDTYAALRYPFVRSFAVGRFAAVAGQQIISVAVGWQLYERTGDPWSLGLVGLVELTPVLLLMVASGTAADRYPRKQVALLAHLVLGLAAAGFAAVSALNAPTGFIYLLLFVVGAARAFSGPSVSTILPQLLSPGEFGNANAWLSSATQLAGVMGPALGGVLIAATGTAAVAFAAAAIGQAIFVAILQRLPSRPPPAVSISRRRQDIFAGFQFVRRNPIFLAAITLDLFAVLFGGAVALLPIFAKDILRVGPAGLGWLRAAPGMGAIVMALVTTRLPPWTHPGRVLLAAVAGFGLATIGFGLSHSVVLSLVCLLLTGVCDNLSVVIRLTLQQTITPDHLRGRVSAVNFVFVGFSNELGAFESGATAALFTPVWSVVGGGLATLAVVVLVRSVWPALMGIGPLHTLRPSEDTVTP